MGAMPDGTDRANAANAAIEATDKTRIVADGVTWLALFPVSDVGMDVDMVSRPRDL